jgi:hypothetical protein
MFAIVKSCSKIHKLLLDYDENRRKNCMTPRDERVFESPKVGVRLKVLELQKEPLDE